MPVALSPIVTAKVKEQLAQKIPQGKIAEDHGIVRETVTRINRRDRDEIEQLTQEYISKSIPLVKANHFKTLELANHVLNATCTDDSGELQPDISAIEQARTLLNLADKKENRVLLAAGVIAGKHQQPSSQVNIQVNVQRLGQQLAMEIESRQVPVLEDLLDDS